MKKVKLLLSGKTRIEYYIDAVERLGAEAISNYPPKIDTQYRFSCINICFQKRKFNLVALVIYIN